MSAFFQQLRESTQLLVYVVAIAAGLGYLLVAWVLGFFGAGHDHDGDTEHGIDHSDAGHHTVSIFSPKIIALFCVGLGVGGSLATVYGCRVTTSALIGLATGLSLGALMIFALRALHSQQAHSNLEIQTAIGRVGTVVTEIPAGGTGEVGISVSGQYTTFFARSSDEHGFLRGRLVKVKLVSGSVLVVEPA